jgi:hypothetical protein
MLMDRQQQARPTARRSASARRCRRRRSARLRARRWTDDDRETPGSHLRPPVAEVGLVLRSGRAGDSVLSFCCVWSQSFDHDCDCRWCTLCDVWGLAPPANRSAQPCRRAPDRRNCRDRRCCPRRPTCGPEPCCSAPRRGGRAARALAQNRAASGKPPQSRGGLCMSCMAGTSYLSSGVPALMRTQRCASQPLAYRGGRRSPTKTPAGDDTPSPPNTPTAALPRRGKRISHTWGWGCCKAPPVPFTAAACLAGAREGRWLRLWRPPHSNHSCMTLAPPPLFIPKTPGFLPKPACCAHPSRRRPAKAPQGGWHPHRAPAAHQ